MKRKSRSPSDPHLSSFDADELEVCKILLEIPLIILQSENRNRRLVTWGVRKRRSAIDPDLYSPPVPAPSWPHLLKPCVGPTCDDDDPIAKFEAPSPATPHSLSPGESDGKPKRSKKSGSYRKKEDLLKMVEELTHQKDCLKTEMENVERLYNKLKALNSELKAKNQQLNLDTAIAEARVESKEQAHPQQPLPLLLHDSAPTSALVVNPMGPRAIPDLNVPQEETLGPEPVSPLDLNLSIDLNADTTQLKRAAATRARKKRLQTNQFLKLC